MPWEVVEQSLEIGKFLENESITFGAHANNDYGTTVEKFIRTVHACIVIVQETVNGIGGAVILNHHSFTFSSHWR